MDNFICFACQRTQAYARSDVSGGITSMEAKSLGWKLLYEGWLCPLCAELPRELTLAMVLRRIRSTLGVKSLPGLAPAEISAFREAIDALEIQANPEGIYPARWKWDDSLLEYVDLHKD